MGQGEDEDEDEGPTHSIEKITYSLHPFFVAHNLLLNARPML